MKRTNIKVFPKSTNFRPGVFFKRHGQLLLFVSLFLFGILMGSIVVKNAPASLSSGIESMFRDYMSARSGQGFFVTLLNSFVSTMPFLLCAFFMGIFVLGVPCTFGVPLFRGLGLGVISGYLYANFGLKGVGFTALLIVPHGLFSSFIIILASKEAFAMSSKLFSVVLPSAKETRLWSSLHMYIIRFIVFMGLILASSLLDAVMAAAFMRFFTF
ncbi:MAG TPA: hypothetical protein DEQ02_04870 [Ruminococcaceae bacterium]|nr:hypothetical protein [Oscillospiraceae bacterium]